MQRSLSTRISASVGEATRIVASVRDASTGAMFACRSFSVPKAGSAIASYFKAAMQAYPQAVGLGSACGSCDETSCAHPKVVWEDTHDELSCVFFF